MVEDADPNRASPQERARRCRECAAEEPTDAERHGEREHTPEREQSIDHVQIPVKDHVARESRTRCRIVLEQPADVCVPQASESRGGTIAVTMRRVRIALCVRERVVAPMIAHPTDDGPFERH
jgi:hypothetical protein